MVITRVKEGENALIYLILKALLELNLSYTVKQHKNVFKQSLESVEFNPATKLYFCFAL